jgi:hypothetical protein
VQEVVRRHRPPGQLAPLVLLADADSVAATAATAARTAARTGALARRHHRSEVRAGPGRESLGGLRSQGALLGPVVGHLNTVTLLLRGSPRSSLSGRFARSLGRRPAWRAGSPGTWKTAGRPAPTSTPATPASRPPQEADDKALGAYLVGSSCVQPAYRERPYARLRRLEGRTHGFTRTDANPSTRAWLVTSEAEAHALAGDERSTLRALDEADTAMNQAGEEDTSRRPRVAFFNRTYLMGERGVALARLEQPEAAQEVLEDALLSLEPEAVKTRPRLLEGV